MEERLAAVAAASMIRNKPETELGCEDGSMGQGRKTRHEPQCGQCLEVPSHTAHPRDSFSRPKEEQVSSPENNRYEDVSGQMQKTGSSHLLHAQLPLSSRV